ncbi:hypothetical protein ACLB2K_004019 [Fragaria x ananassa]
MAVSSPERIRVDGEGDEVIEVVNSASEGVEAQAEMVDREGREKLHQKMGFGFSNVMLFKFPATVEIGATVEMQLLQFSATVET